MRRPLLVVSILLGVALPLSAQVTGPAVNTLAGATVLSGVSHRSSEHGCSQSYESTSSELTTELRAYADGRVVLTFEGHRRSFMGPSLGRYAAGDRDSSETGHALRATVRGTAAFGPESLTVRFTDADLATAYWSGPGTLPLGPSNTVPFARTLRCVREVHPILPAGPATPGELASSQHIAVCRWDGGAPTELVGYAPSGEHWLGVNGGLEETSEDTMFAAGPAFTLRAR